MYSQLCKKQKKKLLLIFLNLCWCSPFCDMTPSMIEARNTWISEMTKMSPAPATVGSVVPTCSSCTSMPPSVLDFGPPFLSLYWITCDSEWSVQWGTVMCVFYWPSCSYINRIHLLRHAMQFIIHYPSPPHNSKWEEESVQV